MPIHLLRFADDPGWAGDVCMRILLSFTLSIGVAKTKFLFATTTPHTTGYFQDKGIIYALQTFRDKPKTMLNLAHLLLLVWAEHNGQSAPTVINICCYFETEDHWKEAVTGWFASPKSVPGAVQALPSDAVCLWKTIRNIKHFRQAQLEDKLLSEMESPKTLANKMWARVLSAQPMHIPRETQTDRRR